MDESAILNAIGDLGRRLDEKSSELGQRLDEKTSELGQRLDGLDQRLDARLLEVDGRFDELHRHFDVVGESLRGDIRLVAEGVIALDQKVDRVERELSTRIRESVVDFRSALGASHRGLDGRVTVLEVEVSDVRSRLERLESEDRG